MSSLLAQSLEKKIWTQVTTTSRDYPGIVVWFDGEEAWTDVLDEIQGALETRGAHFLRFQDSFWRLRHQVDALGLLDLDKRRAPQLVIYVPRDELKCGDALSEIAKLGVVMKSKNVGASHSTKLSSLAKAAALALGTWTEADAETLKRDIETAKYENIAEIERVLSRRSAASGVLNLIFDGGDAGDWGARWLTDEAIHAKIGEKNAGDELTATLRDHFEFETPNSGDLDGARAAFARHILTLDFAVSFEGKPWPAFLPDFTGVSTPARGAARELAHNLRARRDWNESYLAIAQQVQNELHLEAHISAWQEAREGETFQAQARENVRHILHQLATQGEADWEEMATLCAQFSAEFWPSQPQHADLSAQWGVLGAAAHLRGEAARLKKELGHQPADATALWNCYTQGEGAWCGLENAHRHFERLYHGFEGAQVEGDEELLAGLAAKCRAAYTQEAESLNRLWLEAWRGAGPEIAGVLPQNRVWEKHIAPLLATKKRVAYVLVDALRFEMARELLPQLQNDHKVTLESAVAVAPTITEIGMAALLPHAEKGTVQASGKGVSFEIADENGEMKAFANREARVKWLREKATEAGIENLLVAKVEELFPAPKNDLKNKLKKARLAVVTGQEIDALCEGDLIHLARRTMDTLLGDLTRVFRALASCGFAHIVVVADHGFWFGEEIGDHNKIAAPGGETLLLKRRVWVGRGGAADPQTLRVPLSGVNDDASAGADVQLVTPWGFGVFKSAGGARAYFHGGLSLPERVVPILHLQPHGTRQKEGSASWSWTLQIHRDAITTRFCTAQITATTTQLFGPAPRVRLDVWVGEERLSRTLSAAYGFDPTTEEIALQTEGNALVPCAVTLQIEGEAPVGTTTATLRLLDATTGAMLSERNDIAWKLSF